jgi:hypothetical protein
MLALCIAWGIGVGLAKYRYSTSVDILRCLSLISALWIGLRALAPHRFAGHQTSITEVSPRGRRITRQVSPWILLLRESWPIGPGGLGIAATVPFLNSPSYYDGIAHIFAFGIAFLSAFPWVFLLTIAISSYGPRVLLWDPPQLILLQASICLGNVLLLIGLMPWHYEINL